MAQPPSNKQKSESVSSAPLVEGVDYILENGLFVLTREYLLKRGTCCGSGCRHCPYVPRHGGALARAKGSE